MVHLYPVKFIKNFHLNPKLQSLLKMLPKFEFHKNFGKSLTHKNVTQITHMGDQL